MFVHAVYIAVGHVGSHSRYDTKASDQIRRRHAKRYAVAWLCELRKQSPGQILRVLNGDEDDDE